MTEASGKENLPADAADESSMSLSERLLHKKWKVRQEAFQELGNRFAAAEEDDSVFAEHGDDLPKLAGDTNAAAQGQGVATCCTFLERAPAASSCAGALAPVLVSKCLSARMATQRSAREALLLLIDAGAVDDTLEALEGGLKDKKVKVPPTCLQVMRDAVVKHGPALPLNRVADTARDQMNTSNPAARAAVKDLAGALYRHMGEALWVKLSGALRSAQETELKELFAKEVARTDVPAPVPLRQQRAASERGAEAGSVGDGAAAAATAAAPDAAASGTESTDGTAAGADPWAMVEERDLMASLDMAAFEARLAEKKWKDRAAALDNVLELCGTLPKLKPSAEYGRIVTPTLKVACKDVNVMVTSKALQVLAALASGLRASFQGHARALVPELLPKFKEKKRAVVTALTDLLLTLHRHCVRLDEVEDALQAGTRHRLPQVRVGALDWIKQCMEQDPVRCAAPGALKVAVAELEANLGEPDPVVRDAACAALGAYFKRLGFDGPLRALAARIKEHHAHQYDKVCEMAGTEAGKDAASLLSKASALAQAGGDAPAVGSGAAKRGTKSGPTTSLLSGAGQGAARSTDGGQDAAAPASSPDQPHHTAGADSATSQAANTEGAGEVGPDTASDAPSKAAAPRRPTAAAAAKKSSSGGGSSGSGASAADVAAAAAALGGAPGGTDGKALEAAMAAAKEQAGSSSFMKEEEATAVLEQMMGAAGTPWAPIAAQLAQTKWSERVAGLEAIGAALRSHNTGRNQAQVGEAALRVILAKTRALKDSNVNILKAAVETADAAIASVDSAPISKRAVSEVVTPALAKAGDRKAKDAIQAMLLTACEALGPQFVLATCYTALRGPSGRAPPAQQGALDFMDRAVKDFGARTMQVTALVEFCKTDKGLESRSKGVRDAAIGVLAQLYRQRGIRVRKMLEDLKPALLTLADEAFAAAGVVKDGGSSAAAGGGGGSGEAEAPKRQIKEAAAAEAEAAAEEAPPERVDVSAKLGPKLLKKLSAAEGKDAWKTRMAALNEVTEVMDGANRRVLPSKAVRDVMVAMKERFNEKNAALKTRAIRVAGIVANSLGVKAAAFTKFIMKELIVCFADSKRMTRDAVTQAFDDWVAHVPDGRSDGTPTLILDAILPYVPAPLTETAASREPLLQWLGKYVHEWLDGAYHTLPPSSAQQSPPALLKALAPSLVKCLQDRNQAVRDGAALVLGACMRACGEEVAARPVGNCKPAARRALEPYLDRAAELARSRGPPKLDSGSRPQTANQAQAATKAPADGSVVAPERVAPPAEQQEHSVLDAAAKASSSQQEQPQPHSHAAPSAVSSSARTADSAEAEAEAEAESVISGPAGDAPASGGTSTARSQTRRAASAAPARPGTAGEAEAERAVSRPRGRAAARGRERPRGARGDTARAAASSGIPAPGVPRAGMRRGSVAAPSTGGMPSGGGAVAAASGGVASSGPVLKVAPSSAKAGRARRAARDKWTPDLLNSTMAEDLKEVLSSVVRSGELLDMMFSKDARDHAMALVALSRAAREEVEATVASLDLLLKWATVRMTGRENVQTTAKLCEYLLQLFSMLEGRGHRLQQFEASLFAPFLVDKLGHPKPRFRDSYKQVFGLFVPCVGASAAVGALMEGLRSKNMRTRVEVLDELRKLMDAEEASGAFVAADAADAEEAAVDEARFSSAVLGRKGLARVAAQVGTGDADVRHAALRTMEVAWAAYGFDEGAFFAALPSSLPDKIRDMMEERFKFSSLRSAAEQGEAAPPTRAAGGQVPATGIPAPSVPVRAAGPARRRAQGAGKGGGAGDDNIDVDEILGEIERLDVSAVIGDAMGDDGAAVGRPGDGGDVLGAIGEEEEEEEAEHGEGQGEEGGNGAEGELGNGNGQGREDSDVFAFKRLSLSEAVPPTPAPAATTASRTAGKAQATPSRGGGARSSGLDALSLDAENEALWRLSSGSAAGDDTLEKRNAARAVRSMGALSQLLLERGASRDSDGANVSEQPAYQHGLDAVKVVHRMCLDAGRGDSGPAAAAREALGQHACALLSGLLDCTFAAFDPELAGTSSAGSASLVDTRSLSCALSAMMTLLGVPALVARVRVAALRLVVRLCTCGMLHAQLASEAPKLVKALNLLAVRVLDHAPRVAAVHILLRLLRLSGPGGAFAAEAEAEGAGAGAADGLSASLRRRDGRCLPSHLARETAKMVAKMLLRLSRGDEMGGASAAPSPGAVVDVKTGDARGLAPLSAAETRALLRESHVLVTVHPSAAPPAGEEDVVLAGLKTFLAALACAWAPAEHAGGALTSLCASALPQASPMHAIMAPLVQRHRAGDDATAAMSTPTSSPAAARASTSAPTSPYDVAIDVPAEVPSQPDPSSPTDTAVDTAAELTSIFARIQSPATSEVGVEALHAFRKRHPDAELAPHLAKLSPFFRQFVLDELDKLDRASSAQAPPGTGTGGEEGTGDATSSSQPAADGGASSGVAAATARMHAQMMATAALAAEGARESSGAGSEAADTVAAPAVSAAASAGQAQVVADREAAEASTNGSGVAQREGETLTAAHLRSRLADLKARYQMRTSSASSADRGASAALPAVSSTVVTSAPQPQPQGAAASQSAGPQQQQQQQGDGADSSSTTALDGIRARLEVMRTGSGAGAAQPAKVAGPSDLSQLREKIARMKERRSGRGEGQ